MTSKIALLLVVMTLSLPLYGNLPKNIEQYNDAVATELAEIESLLQAQQFVDAYNKSKALKNRVKLQTGVHPKARIRELIPVTKVLNQLDYKLSFEDLSNAKKRGIAEAIRDYRGGHYLDLLNLAKRAQALYNMALYYKYKKEQRLYPHILQKIYDDIVESHAIAIELYDTTAPAGNSMMLFDSDVADEDFQLEFNLELVLFLMSIEELGEGGLTETEVYGAFDKYIKDMKADHVRGFSL